MSNPHDTAIRETDARAARQGEIDGGEAMQPMQADRPSGVNPAVETPVEARQGFLGKPVLGVLVAGLILVGIAWIVVHYAVQ